MFENINYIDDTYIKDLPKRKLDSHKGTYGKVLAIVGSENTAGAAILSVNSAYRLGAGLVKVFASKALSTTLSLGIVEAIFSFYENDITEDRLRLKIRQELDFADIILIGSGLADNFENKIILEEVLKNFQRKIIIDATAINILARDEELKKYIDKRCILTPHLKEMSRFTGFSVDYIKENALDVAKQFYKKYKASLVLKSAKTIIVCDAGIFINNNKISALSKAGSGDILSGIIAGLYLVFRADLENSTSGVDKSRFLALATYIHRLAAAFASKNINEHSLIARDIVDNIGLAIKEKFKEF